MNELTQHDREERSRRISQIERNLLTKQAMEIYEREQAELAQRKTAAEASRTHRIKSEVDEAVRILAASLPYYEARDTWLMKGGGSLDELHEIAVKIRQAEGEAAQRLQVATLLSGEHPQILMGEARKRAGLPESNQIVPQGAPVLAVIIWRGFASGIIGASGIGDQHSFYRLDF